MAPLLMMISKTKFSNQILEDLFWFLGQSQVI